MAESSRKEQTPRAATTRTHPSLDGVKRGQGLLSFRSRKLLGQHLKNDDASGGDNAAPDPTRTAEKLDETHDDLAEQSIKEERRKSLRSISFVVESDYARPKSREAPKPPMRAPIVELSRERSAPSKLSQQLSPRLKLLETFYEGLEAAISLLAIRRQMCSFKAVCKTVESMSKRRFLPKHLSQIKHLFPEVLQLDYVQSPDLDSGREKWDLRITLLPLPSDRAPGGSPVKSAVGQAGVRRRKEFRARLHEFAKSHPKEADVPQDPLPQRFSGASSLQGTSKAQEPSIPKDLNEDGLVGIHKSIEKEVVEKVSEVECPEAGFSSEEFEFCVVKPSRASSPPLEDSSHFPGSFRPFFSAKLKPDSVSSSPLKPNSVSSSPSENETSHFITSFKPFFSVKHHREAFDTVGVSDAVQSNEVHEHASSSSGGLQCTTTSKACDDDEEEEAVAVGSCPAADGRLASTPARASSSYLVEDSKHFSPSFRPVFSLQSNKMSPATPASSCGQVPPSPVPIHTPPFLSPSNTFQSTQSPVTDVSFKTPLSHPTNDPAAIKSRATMRSLKFGSPTRPPRPVKNSTPETQTCSPATPVPRTPGRTSMSREDFYSPLKANKLSRGSLFSKEEREGQDLETDISRTSAAKSKRSMEEVNDGIVAARFESHAGYREKAEALLEGSPHVVRKTLKGISETDLGLCHSVKASPIKLQTLNSPATPVPHTPVRIARGKEFLYSPPKRTKFNRGSLFSREETQDQGLKSQVLSASAVSHGVEAKTGMEEAKGGIAVAEIDSVAGCRVETEAQLKVAPLVVKKIVSGISEADLDILHCLPAELIQSVREKERRIQTENSEESIILRRRQQMMAGVPKLFNQLRLIFQSLHRSVLPGTELLKNVLSASVDITDKGEVEERLQLLIELAPEWITTRLSHSGEPIYRIDKRADMAGIQRKLLASKF